MTISKTDTAIAALISKIRSITTEEAATDYRNDVGDGFPVSFSFDFEEDMSLETIRAKAGHQYEMIHVGLFQDFDGVQRMSDNELDEELRAIVVDLLDHEKEAELQRRADAAEWAEIADEM
ncbi:hypothetical protein FLP41_15275 [Paracoccus marcusii]|uniref:hypothetical protein n=1 Tax=Paracoccus marcusii TaxID=59779 RepID=UPI002ED0B634|nr:hypothetical protein FLP41_15275 [Paracoccus marcusii]